MSEYSGDSTQLLYLRARYYSPLISSFLTRDTWEGDYNNPLSLNRWIYGYGNPIINTDPSGHGPGVPSDWRESFVQSVINQFGITFSGEWSPDARFIIANAVWDVGFKFDSVLQQISSPSVAFKAVYRYGVDFRHNTNCYGCRPFTCIQEGKYSGESSKGEKCTPKFGVTNSESSIEFASFYETNYLKGRNNTVHELGHAFNNRLRVGNYKIPELVLSTTKDWTIDCVKYAFPHRDNAKYGPYYGFASPTGYYTWQMNPSPEPTEEFADTFLGWVYNTWETDPLGNLTLGGRIRSEWADQWMTGWLNTIVNSHGG